MPTEEQPIYNPYAYYYLASGIDIRAGQKLTIPNRIITKLAFMLCKVNSPTGDVTFTIRKVSDDSIINSKIWGNASVLPDYPSYQYQEVTFDTPVLINQEVRILCEFSGGNVSNAIGLNYCSSTVKPNECFTYYKTNYSDVGYDAVYVYTYTIPLSPPADNTIVKPKVSLEAIRNIEMSTMGRVYVDEQGNFTYESRYARNPHDFI